MTSANGYTAPKRKSGGQAGVKRGPYNIKKKHHLLGFIDFTEDEKVAQTPERIAALKGAR